MSSIIRIFCLLSVFILNCGFSLTNNTTVDQGRVIYAFESGKIECLSQIDPNGKIVVLLKSAKENTEVEFNKIIHSKKKGYILQGVMQVEEDTNLCAGWLNVQEINIAIDPKPVSAITLTGKQVYASDDITVLILPTKKSTS
jgi:hypothetical protein